MQTSKTCSHDGNTNRMVDTNRWSLCAALKNRWSSRGSCRKCRCLQEGSPRRIVLCMRLRDCTANEVHKRCTSHAAKILGKAAVSTALLPQNAKHGASILGLILG